MGTDKGSTFLTIGWILSQFHKDRKAAVSRYKTFVLEGIRAESPWEELKGQIFFGNPAFVEKYKGILAGKEVIEEIPKAQRYATRPTLDEIFGRARQDKGSIKKAICKAHMEYDYRLREIGDHIGVHYSTISRVVKRMG